jgi:hypothetical protein
VSEAGRKGVILLKKGRDKKRKVSNEVIQTEMRTGKSSNAENIKRWEEWERYESLLTDSMG